MKSMMTTISATLAIVFMACLYRAMKRQSLPAVTRATGSSGAS